MYLPRPAIAQLYTHLVSTTHSLSPPVLILTSLTVDGLAATRILTALLKRDYVPHKVQPIAGYGDLARAGQELILPLTRQRGGEGAVVVCLGLGGGVDIEEVLGLDGQRENGEAEDMSEHGVEVWLVDARRPWNLQNVYGSGISPTGTASEAAVASRAGVDRGKLLPSYRPGKGGVIIWDDGDIEAELSAEREAFMALQEMPEITEEDIMLTGAASEDGHDDEDPSSSSSRKRKSNSDDDDNDDNNEEERPRQRRRSNSGTPIPSSPSGNPHSAQLPPPSSQPDSPGAVIPSSPHKQPSQSQLRRKLLNERRKHEATLERYYRLGTSHAEPVSSMLYSLASDLGREDNDLLWLAIVGISSADLSPLSTASRHGQRSGHRVVLDKSEQIKEVLRDEVRRLNVPDSSYAQNNTAIPTHARSPTDTSIRLSPEPAFLLIRHWSLYDSMLHSPFLSTRLHVWSDAGRKRLHKLLAKMGVSLVEAGKGYAHMDVEIKRTLRERLEKVADVYALEGVVPTDGSRTGGGVGWGFVRSWGWKATLSAVDVATVVGAILEVGTESSGFDIKWDETGRYSGGNPSYSSRVRASLPTPPHSEDGSQADRTTASAAAAEVPDWTTTRFFTAYDALSPSTNASHHGLSTLLQNIPTAQQLYRAILRTGSTLIGKKQIRHLRSFRMGVVKEGPDVPLFTHPGALTKLAGWVSEAVAVLEAEKGRSHKSAADDALVLGCLDENRSVYVVVGLGGGGNKGGRVRSKAEIKEREERKKRKEAAKAAKTAERARKRAERRRLRREIREANGLIDSDDEADQSDATESAASTSSESGTDESDDELAEKESKHGSGLNRFGQAFQEVVEETGARVRIDSFEHSVVEVRKEDLAGFLEALSLKSVVG